MQILTRGSEPVISSWLVIYGTLEQEATFALASILVLTVVIDCRALNLHTSDFGGHGRVSVGPCRCPYCAGASLLRCSLFGHIRAPMCLGWAALFFSLSRALFLYRNRLSIGVLAALLSLYPILVLLGPCPLNRLYTICRV